MENRKLVEDRTAVGEPEVSEAATPTRNGTAGKETAAAEAGKPAGNSTTPSPEQKAADSGSAAEQPDPEPDPAQEPGPAQEPAAAPDRAPATGASSTGQQKPADRPKPANPATSTTSWSGSNTGPAATPPPAPAPVPAGDGSDVIDWGAEDQGGLFGTKVPIGVALVMAVVLPAVGFLIGMIGSGKDSSSTTINALITPQNASGPLKPGKTVQFTVLVPNDNDYGVQVSKIREGSSQATPGGGCAEGTVTSAEVDGPRGYIRPNGVRAYQVNATMAANTPQACVNQSFTLPLTVDLESAAG